MRKENIYLVVVIIVAITGGVIFFINGRTFLEAQKKNYQEEIINCLLSKKIKLYIASSCSFCEEQKEIFGEYFDKMDVENCNRGNDWSEACRKEEINSVPTWAFSKNLRMQKDKILSCEECKKESEGINCYNNCYTESKDGRFLRISGFLTLDNLSEIFNCQSN